MSDSTITFIVLGPVVVLFVTNRIPVAIIALATSVALWATGVLDLGQATAGFGDPAVLFIASLFVVSEALEATGVTAWAGQQLIDRAGSERARILIAMVVLCALVTALITPNASVAALVPVTVIVARRVGQQTSQLMIPLAYAAHAGALLALTGSPVSVVVSEAADDAGAGYFGFFEFALTGIPLLIGTVAIVLLLGPVLLPHRDAERGGRDLSGHELTLVGHYRVEGEDATQLFGRRYGAGASLTAVVAVHGAVAALIPVVVASGAAVGASPSRLLLPLAVAAHAGSQLTLTGSQVNILFSEASRDAGDGYFTFFQYTAVGAPLLAGTLAIVALGTRRLLPDRSPAVDVAGSGPGLRPFERHRAGRALVIVATMVVILATGLVPPAVAGLGAAAALVVTGVLTPRQAARGVDWTTIVLIAGMIPLSTALTTSGAADDIAHGITSAVGDRSVYALLAVLFVIAGGLTQLMSNTATALVMIPIAVQAAYDLDVSVRPVLMSVNVVVVAALLTPVGTAANTMILRPGGYRNIDYLRFGLPLVAWWFVIAVFYVPIIWRP